MRVKVRDVMTKDVICAEIPGKRDDALDLLRKHGISGAPVVKKGTRELVGVVSVEDLLMKPEEDQLAMLMTRSPCTIGPDEDISVAARKMVERKIRRLPVVEDDEVVGIISVRDIINKMAEFSINSPVRDCVGKRISAVWEETPVTVTLAIMKLSKSRVLPVLDSEGRMVGVVDQSDIISSSRVVEESKISSLSAPIEGEEWSWDSNILLYITKKLLKLPNTPVKNVMTRKVVTATQETSISECARRMKQHDIENLFILEEGDIPMGIIRDIDLLKAIT